MQAFAVVEADDVGGDIDLGLRMVGVFSLFERKGFVTRLGAVGNISEIVALLASRFPQIRFVLEGIPDSKQWRGFPERQWECKKICGAMEKWSIYHGVDDGLPWCADCDTAMREVEP